MCVVFIYILLSIYITLYNTNFTYVSIHLVVLSWNLKWILSYIIFS